MNSLYSDDYCILDASFLISAATANGTEAEDGKYFIFAIIRLEQAMDRMVFIYPDEAQRDRAFTAISLLAKGWAEFVETLENEE